MKQKKKKWTSGDVFSVFLQLNWLLSYCCIAWTAASTLFYLHVKTKQLQIEKSYLTELLRFEHSPKFTDDDSVNNNNNDDSNNGNDIQDVSSYLHDYK